MLHACVGMPFAHNMPTTSVGMAPQNEHRPAAAYVSKPAEVIYNKRMPRSPDTTELPSTGSRALPPLSDLLVIGVALVLPSLVTWIYFVALAGSPAAVQQSAYSIGKAIQFVLPVAWLYLAHRKHWLDGWTFTREGLLAGVVFGAIVAGAMVVLYAWWLKPAGFFDEAAVTVREKIGGMAINTIWKFALLGVFYALMHSFLEEYYWRWFVFRQLNQMSPASAAIALSSLGFMAHHVILLAQYFGWLSPATWFFSLSVAVGGVVWAWLYWHSGSLLGPWMSHLLIDAAIFVIGYDLTKEMLK